MPRWRSSADQRLLKVSGTDIIGEVEVGRAAVRLVAGGGGGAVSFDFKTRGVGVPE